MATNEENVTKILSVLSHPLRRQILLFLNEQECSFTDIATEFGVDTGKLSFHLRSLEAFIEQTETGKYKLSETGQNAIIIIKDLESWALEANIAQRSFIRPLSNWKKRAAAYLIDFIIALLLFIVLPNSLYPITLELFLLNENILIFIVLFWIYSSLLEGFSGQTLGKKVTKIKVMSVDGKNISYEKAAVRNFGKVFLLPVDLVLGWRLKDERFIRYFDKYAGTIVLDLKPEKRPIDLVPLEKANQTSQKPLHQV